MPIAVPFPITYWERAVDSGTITTVIAILALGVSIIGMPDTAVSRMRRALPHISKWVNRFFYTIGVANSVYGVVAFYLVAGVPTRLEILFLAMHVVILILLPAIAVLSHFMDRLRAIYRTLDLMLDVPVTPEK